MLAAPSAFLADLGIIDVGDTRTTASNLGVLTDTNPVQISSRIDVASDRDVFNFQADTRTTVRIEMTATSGSFLDTFITLLDADGNTIASDDDSGPGVNSRLTVTIEAGQAYYVESRGFGISVGGYSLTLTTVVDFVGDTLLTATDLGVLSSTLPIQVSGTIETAGDRDVYQFQADSDGNAVIDLSAANVGGLETEVTLLDSTGMVIPFNNSVADTTSSRTATVQASQTYFVEVRGIGDSTGDYNLTLRIADAISDTATTATALELGILRSTEPLEFSSVIDTAGDRDVFQFQVESNGTAVTELISNASNLDPVLRLLDSFGNELAVNDDGGGSLNSQLSYPLEAGQTYFIEARSFGLTTGNYQLKIRYPADVVGNSPASAADLGVLAVGRPLTFASAIETVGDQDVFTFQTMAEEFTDITIDLDATNSSGLNTRLVQVDNAGSIIGPNAVGDSTSNSRLTLSFQKNQTYYIRVEGVDTIGEYLVTLRIPDDPVGDTTSTALDLKVLSRGITLQYSSAIDEATDRDVFKFQAKDSGRVVVQLSAGSSVVDGGLSDLNPIVRLLGTADKSIATPMILASDDDGGSGRDSLLAYNVEAGQTYFVDARDIFRGTGEYNLTIRMLNDGVTDPEGDTPAKSFVLGVLGLDDRLIFSGSIDHSQDTDVFQFQDDFPDEITITLRGPASGFLDTSVTLLTSNGTVILPFENGFPLANRQTFQIDPDEFGFDVFGATFYTVIVHGISAAFGDYTLTVSNVFDFTTFGYSANFGYVSSLGYFNQVVIYGTSFESGSFQQLSGFSSYVQFGAFGQVLSVHVVGETAASAVAVNESGRTSVQNSLQMIVTEGRFAIQNQPFELLVTNNGIASGPATLVESRPVNGIASAPAMLGESRSLDFVLSMLDQFTATSMLRTDGNLYVSAEGKELFTVFDLQQFNARAERFGSEDWTMQIAAGNGLFERGISRSPLGMPFLTHIERIVSNVLSRSPGTQTLFASEEERRSLLELTDAVFSAPVTPLPVRQLWQVFRMQQTGAHPPQNPDDPQPPQVPAAEPAQSKPAPSSRSEARPRVSHDMANKGASHSATKGAPNRLPPKAVAALK